MGDGEGNQAAQRGAHRREIARIAEQPPVRAVGTSRSQVGESPLWSPADGALWWVDIEGRALHRHRLQDGADDRWRTDERIACIALCGGGGLVAAMESGIFRLRPGADGELTSRRIATARHPRDGMRFNDGRTDRQGRFWVTSMVRDMALAAPAGGLFRFDSAGLSAPVVDGLVTGNGLAFSPDGSVLYLSDSHPTVRRVWRFALDGDGRLADRRLFADMGDVIGRPDGAAVDRDGGYWTAANDDGLLIRFAPDGRLDRALRVPVSKPSMVAFGGPHLDRLFVTSIRPAAPAPGFDPALEGATLVLDPGARGLAETPFAFLAPEPEMETP